MASQMTRSQWVAEVRRRIAINEGSRTTMYRDTMGIKTIGIGFNLERGDAASALAKAGVPQGQISGVINGTIALTEDQVNNLFDLSFAPIEQQARASLADGIYDALSDARRFVICDLIFNLGNGGWLQFRNTRNLIAQAQSAKDDGKANAAALFGSVADALKSSAWYSQVGNRARRNVAMMRKSVWCSATGDGSDI